VVIDESPRDLAILRIHGERGFQALPLGPASDLMVGETVIAVGHPFGYAHTVSQGIVSALGREITMPSGDVLSGLIQTDASINPGNSGGPLLNINGELIGINVALREGAQGIAFAINAEQVKEVLSRQLSVSRMAGLCHGLSCSEKVRSEGPNRQRVVVARVGDETPAAQAGVRPGDEILLVAGRPVVNRFDVERSLWGYRSGERVPLRILRQGKEMTVPLTLAPPHGETWTATPPAAPTVSSPSTSDAGAAEAAARGR
jgi:serine protease Do